MAESFPLPGFHSIGLRLVTGIRTRRDEGGMRVTARRGTPFWRGPMVTGWLQLPEQTAWLTFLDRCVESNLRVDYVHPYYSLPAAYTSATWPLEADATVSAVTDLRTLELAGLDIGMELRAGDRLTIIEGSNRCYRALAADVTVTSETAEEIQLTGRMPSGLFTTAATVCFEDPYVRLAIVPDSWDPEQVNGPMGLSFEVEEVFR